MTLYNAFKESVAILSLCLLAAAAGAGWAWMQIETARYAWWAGWGFFALSFLAVSTVCHYLSGGKDESSER